jgi:Protein of unknown function (DUF3574)
MWMKRISWLLALAAGLGGAACARSGVAGPAPAAALCAVGDTALVRDLVYFGRNRPDGGTVTDAEWLGFLDSVVTPSFPNGFTVVEGVGQWKGQSGAVERERSAIITFLHSGSPADRDRVAQVASEYKRRFHQEAVLRERTPACARFE